MRIVVKDNNGKEMVFETLYEVDVKTDYLGEITVEAEEWILTSGTNNWFENEK